MFGLFRRRESVSNINITVIRDEDDELFDVLEEAHEARVTELLEHNNAQLQQNRDLKALVRKLTKLAQANSDLLIEHSATTGYCGCDLEKDTFLAVMEAKALVNVG